MPHHLPLLQTRFKIKGQFQLLVISSKVTANDLVAPTACFEAINWLRWPPPVPLFSVYLEVFEQQYTSCVKVGTGGNTIENTIRNYLGLCFIHGGIVL